MKPHPIRLYFLFVVALVPLVLLASGSAKAGPEDGYTLHVEGEAYARVAKPSSGRIVAASGGRRPTGFSKNSWLHWYVSRPNETLRVPVRLAHAGHYRVAVIMGHGPKSARVQIGIGSKTKFFEGFSRRFGSAGRVDVARVNLTKGVHEVSFRVAGRHPHARGWEVLIDGLAFERVGPYVRPGPRPGPRVPPPNRAPPTDTRPPTDRPSPPSTLRPGVGTQALVLAPYRPDSRLTIGALSLPQPVLEVETEKRVVDSKEIFFGLITRVGLHERKVSKRYQLSRVPMNATQVRWQVSAFEPDATGRVDKTPAGLLGQGRVALAPGSWQRRTFDVSLDLRRAGLGGNPLDLAAFSSDLKRRVAALEAATDTPRRPRRTHPERTLAPGRIEQLETLYVRVIPLDAAGRAVAKGSTPIRIERSTPPDFTFADETAPRAPRAKLVSYTPLRWLHPKAHLRFVAARDVKWSELDPILFKGNDSIAWKKGQQFDYSKPADDSKEWYEYVSEVFQGIVDLVNWVADAITWVAEQYNAIKELAVDFASQLCPKDLPECRAVISGLLDSGLAALGIPPDLPTWDELVAIGEGELVDVIAKQAKTALPAAGIVGDLALEAGTRELARRLVSHTKTTLNEAVKQREAGGSGAPAPWMKPDPLFLYRPAILKVRVTNPTSHEVEGRISAFVPGVLSSPGRILRLRPSESKTLTFFLRESIDLRMDVSAMTPTEQRMDRQERLGRFWATYDKKTLPIQVGVSNWRVAGTYANRGARIAVATNHHLEHRSGNASVVGRGTRGRR